MSDFSLMDAIECGIVKLPRASGRQYPWWGDAEIPQPLGHISTCMPRKGRGKAKTSTHSACRWNCKRPSKHSMGTTRKPTTCGRQWTRCRLLHCVVCNNTSTSKLVYDYIAGFHRDNEDGSTTLENGRLELFRNFDEHSTPLGRPRTLLIDSEQLESGEKLDDNFRAMAADEIDRFRREIIERTGDRQQADNITDQDRCARS